MDIVDFTFALSALAAAGAAYAAVKAARVEAVARAALEAVMPRVSERIRELEEERNDAERDYAEAQRNVSDWVGRATAAEARLAKAVVLLRTVVYLHDRKINPSPETVERWRATLAEIGGDR